MPFPIETDFISPALRTVRQTLDQNVAKEARDVLLILQRNLAAKWHRTSSFAHLPRLQAFNVDDGSVLIEWIFNDFRIGFSIEPMKLESSWYLVSNARLGNISVSGRIADIDIELLVRSLIDYVLAHTRSPCYGL